MVIAAATIWVPHAGFVSQIIDLANSCRLGLATDRHGDTGGDAVVGWARLRSGCGCAPSSRIDGTTVAARDAQRKPFRRPAVKQRVFAPDAVDLDHSVGI